MARNLREGPDWLPVVEVLGPVVETEDGQRGKRHADHMATLSSYSQIRACIGLGTLTDCRGFLIRAD